MFPLRSIVFPCLLVMFNIMGKFPRDTKFPKNLQPTFLQIFCLTQPKVGKIKNKFF